jgi:pimeloyl-ACP methyl ester carboxylesterase
VLWGERDRHFPPVHGERLNADIQGSQLRIIPRAEHWMALYLADRVADEIRDYVMGMSSQEFHE